MGSFIGALPLGRILQQVEDLVQDVFLAAFQLLADFNSEKGHFSTWLLRIARNKCLNETRRKRDLIAVLLPDRADLDTPGTLVCYCFSAGIGWRRYH